jgi:uncharacterized protein DUF3873
MKNRILEGTVESDIKGCSTCPKGQEQHETFMRDGKEFVQYDYRTNGGELFSCVAGSLELARQQRDSWMAR